MHLVKHKPLLSAEKHYTKKPSHTLNAKGYGLPAFKKPITATPIFQTFQTILKKQKAPQNQSQLYYLTLNIGQIKISTNCFQIQPSLDL